MNEAVHCLEAARKAAVTYREGCAESLAEHHRKAAESQSGIDRMDTRIKEIDAAIKKLGGKQER